MSGFAVTTPSLALVGLVRDDSVTCKVLLYVLLVLIGQLRLSQINLFTGVCLNLMLVPLAVDMFDEVEVFAEKHPGTSGKLGAFAQAYSLFDAALVFATVIGPGWAGLFFENTTWQITAVSFALLCAAGSVPVFLFRGGIKKGKAKTNGSLGVVSAGCDIAVTEPRVDFGFRDHGANHQY